MQLICFWFHVFVGIGKRTGEQLTAAGIETLGQLRDASIDTIVNAGFPRWVSTCCSFNSNLYIHTFFANIIE